MYNFQQFRQVLLFVVAGGLLLPVTALAQQSSSAPPQYDGIQAGLDAYRLGEERRRADLQHQLDVNEDLRAWSGLPGMYGETIWYRDPVSAYRRRTLDSLYGYGYGGPDGYGPYRPRWRGVPAGVFEPWPYVPGDLWGYRYTTPWRQPVGQWQGQTGPNRWESHPVYDPPLPNYRPLPPVVDDGEQETLPPPLPTPASKPRLNGPTEF